MKTHGCLMMLVLEIAMSVLSSAHADVDESYDFSWLDPDKKIYVLQNRKFEKAMHAFVSISGGTGYSSAYLDTYQVVPRLGFYFTEWLGIEGFYWYGFNSRSNTFRALEQTGTTVIPRVRELNSMTGGLLHYSPWYAKINVFNSLLYFDWYFAGGAGMIQSTLDTNTTRGAQSNFVDESLLGLFLGTGHLYHISQRFLFRLDFLGAFYSAPLLGNQGEDTWFTNYYITAGLAFKL